MIGKTGILELMQIVNVFKLEGKIMEAIHSAQTSEVALEAIISNVIQIPGVKVDRKKFLADCFAKEKTNIQKIVDLGPIEAGCSREMLSRIANKLILTRTSSSSAASFAMGLPGGLLMGATIPGDAMQFFGMSLRLAQELAYLYGAPDLWENGEINDEAIRGQLILYCGVMFGVSGATAGVRVLSSQIAKTTLKKLPQQALTKTVWYPLVKKIGTLIGVKVTKSTVAKGVSKAIPVIGGVMSGGLNFASMLPMARRLADTLDKANFEYTEEEILEDYQAIQEISKPGSTAEQKLTDSLKDRAASGIKHLENGIGGLLSKAKKSRASSEAESDIFEKIEKLAKLREMGAITQEEFDTKKADLLAKI